jgi:hypothetical protein
MLTASDAPYPPIGVAELAAGQLDLALDPDGTPQQSLIAVDLDADVDGSTVAAAVAAARNALPLLVGIAHAPIAPGLQPLVSALTTTLVPGPARTRACVAVDDVTSALGSLAASVGTAPRAAVVLGHVLRQTGSAATAEGLAAEAAAYSMLLAGPEVQTWLGERGAPREAGDADLPRVRAERDGATLRVELTRAHRRNAMDWRLREALVEALAVAVADPDLTVELTGEGPDFCSGGDFDEFGSAADVTAAYLVRLERHPGWLLDRLRDRVRVRLHGACIGAGVEMPAFAGHVACAPGTSFALPEVGMGLIPGAGGTVSIPRRIGRWRTAWMALTGERVGAVTALEWGLVDEMCA